MKKFALFLVIGFVVGFLVGIVIDKFVFTGKTVEGVSEDGVPPTHLNEGVESYTYTKAICNSDNECIDVFIECEDGEVKNVEPVSELKKFNDLDGFDFERGEFC